MDPCSIIGSYLFVAAWLKLSHPLVSMSIDPTVLKAVGMYLAIDVSNGMVNYFMLEFS